jgi:hypothetical protein
MNEVLPGVLHWTTHHEGIGSDVHSHFAVEAAALIDPRVPAGGVDEIAQYGRPDRILLSNRHHLRHSECFAEAFGCPIRCHEAGLHEFGDGPPVQPFRFGDAGPGALLFADGLIRGSDGTLAFVPDWLMGDDPETVKDGLLESLRRLLGEDFDALLFAHGEPLASGGYEALRAFAG